MSLLKERLKRGVRSRTKNIPVYSQGTPLKETVFNSLDVAVAFIASALRAIVLGIAIGVLFMYFFGCAKQVAIYKPVCPTLPTMKEVVVTNGTVRGKSIDNLVDNTIALWDNIYKLRAGCR